MISEPSYGRTDAIDADNFYRFELDESGSNTRTNRACNTSHDNSH